MAHVSAMIELHRVRRGVRRTPAPARGPPQSQLRPSPLAKFVRSSLAILLWETKDPRAASGPANHYVKAGGHAGGPSVQGPTRERTFRVELTRPPLPRKRAGAAS